MKVYELMQNKPVENATAVASPLQMKANSFDCVTVAHHQLTIILDEERKSDSRCITFSVLERRSVCEDYYMFVNVFF